MSAPKSLPSYEALEKFREHHPEFNTIEKILSLTEARFVQEYAGFFNGNERKARRLYHEAQEMQERAVLLWANIKDAVASPYIRQTLFNNLPETFIRHQQSIPGYDRLFGKLDFVECDHCRSIFGPAAYFVDLLRFIEKHIPQDQVPRGHSLASRQPRLYSMTLDCENTHNLIPYIDLVIEVLEDIVRTGKYPDPYQLVEETVFPIQLPAHLPLDEIRLYLKQLKTRLEDIYRVFGRLAPEVAREVLALSPREYAMIENPQTDKAALDNLYGIDTGNTGPGSIQDVEVFLQQTALDRKTLNELIFLDLSDAEIQAGLSRRFFINNTGDKQGHIWIDEDKPFMKADSLTGQYDCLMNLTLPKLDRIYRFLKLARKLEWSFADLDRALRSLAQPSQPENVLYFDGVNDYVSIRDVQDLDSEAFTLEAWVHPDEPGTHPVFCKGSAGGPFTQYLLWITPQGKLAFYHYNMQDAGAQLKAPEGSTPYPREADGTLVKDALHVTSHQAIPFGAFSHVAVSVNQQTELSVDHDQRPSTPSVSKPFYQVNFYINGILDSTWSLEKKIEFAAPPTTGGPLEINLGRNLHDDFFKGSIKEVRLWHAVRSEAVIREGRYRRFDGRESGLSAYWPLADTPYHELRDIAVNDGDRGNPLKIHHGTLGGKSHSAAPKWIQRDLILDPLPSPVSPFSYLFNGVDQYLGAADVNGLAFSAFTLEGWVSRSGSGPHPIISKGSAAQKKTHFALSINAANRLVLKSSSLNKTYIAGTAVPNNTLVHVAAVVDTGKVFLYLNGKIDNNNNSDKYPADTRQVDKDRLDFALDPQGDDLYIGRSFYTAHMKGTAGELRFWNIPRTPEQLNSHMHRQLIGNEPGLAGYWRLDEPDPRIAVARDRCHNQNHLTPGGISAEYQPVLETQPEVILPLPIAVDAKVLAFDARHYQLVLCNNLNHGLGHHEQSSLEFWFKSANPQAADRKQLLFSQADAETGVSIYLWQASVHLYAWCTPFGRGDTVSQDFHFSSDSVGPLQPGQWHHLCFTYDETPPGDAVQCSFYLNGIKQDHTAGGFRLRQTGRAFLGGISLQTQTRFADGPPRQGSHHFEGQISDLRLWKKALAEAVISNPPDARHPRHVPPPEDEDLVCYLPMTEGYGRPVSDHAGPLFSQGDLNLDTITLYDQSVNAHQGKLYAGPDPVTQKWRERCLPVYLDTALKLNGAGDHLHIPAELAAALKNHAFTIEAWVKIEAFNRDHPLIGCDGPQQTDPTRRELYLLITADGELKAGFNGDEVLSQEKLTAGNWHHIAWCYDLLQRTQTLFIDGQALANNGNNSDGFQGETALFIGRWRHRTDRETVSDDYFAGEISEVRIWAAARSNADVLSHWQRRLTGTEQDLLAYWQFDRDPRYIITDPGPAGLSGLIETASDVDIESKWVEALTPINRALALELDGNDDYIDIQEYEITRSGTIELWLKFSRERDQVLFDASNDDKSKDTHGKEKYFFLEVKRRKLVLRLEDDADHDIANAKINLRNLSPDFDNEWHHVAATWNFDSATETTFTELYLDDLPKASDSKKPNGIKPFLQSLYIGINRGDYDNVKTNPFRGQISQVRIWDSVKTEEALRAQRDAILQGNEEGLRVYLPIHKGRGNRLHNLAADQPALLQVGPGDHFDSKWLDDAGLPATPARVFQFDRDAVVLPQSNRIGITGGDFTIETWVNLAEDTAQYPVLGTRGPLAPQPEEELNFSILRNRPRAVMNGQELLADIVIGTRSWHHIAWRYDSAARQLDILIDGVKDAQMLEMVSPYTANRSVSIGFFKHIDPASKKWVTNHFQGMIADLRVWNQYRSASEISGLMARRLTGAEPGLAAYWAMTAEHLHTVFDVTSRRHPLTFSLAEGDTLSGKYISADPPLPLPRPCPDLDSYNDYLDLGQAYAPNGKSWTIECWTKLHKTAGRQILFSKARLFRAVFEEGCLQFEWQFANKWQTWEEILTIEAEVWFHVALVYHADNNHELQVFLNGRRAASQSQRLPIDRESALRFGASEDLVRGEFLQGQLAELRLWDTALAPEVLFDHFQHRRTGREDDLVGYWPLSEGREDRLYDLAENLPAATLVSGLENPAAKWRPAPPPIANAQSAVHFDGRDDMVILPDISQLPFSSTFTVEAWVRVEDPAMDQLLPVVGSAAPRDTAKDNRLLCLGVKNGAPYFSFYNNDFHPDISLDDQWHHLVWQYEAETSLMRIIVDGEHTREENAHSPFAGQGNAYIGRWSNWIEVNEAYESRYFRGFIGEVRIWNTLRSIADIAKDMGRRIPADSAGLSAYWIFDDHHDTRLFSTHGDADNPYYLTLDSQSDARQPLWKKISDHPVLLNPLSRTALRFDGEKKYLAAENVQLPIEKTFTLETWLSCDHNQDSAVVWKGSADGDTDFELRVNAGGLISFLYRKENETDADPLNRLISDAPLPASAFTHVAVVTSAERLLICLNGLESKSTMLDAPVRNGDSCTLLIGRNSDGTYYNGKLKALRIWNTTRSIADIEDNRFHSLPEATATSGLIGYWPLDPIEVRDDASFAPDRSINNHHLRLGGLENSRKPVSAQAAPTPMAFFDRRRRALTPIDRLPALIQIPKSNPPLFPHRSQRTIELWFMSRNTLSHDRQTVYRESDGRHALYVYLEKGLLHFEGYISPEKERYPLVTDRVQSGRWHHLAIVLDGRAELRDDAFCALLDGKVIDTRPALQLSDAAREISLGGLGFTPYLDPPRLIQTGDITPAQTSGDWHDYPAGGWSDHNKAKGSHALAFTHRQEDGWYRLCLRYPKDNPLSPRQATNTPVEIVHKAGTASLTVNQQTGGGEFRELGIFELEKDASTITIRNDGTDGWVLFEALKVSRIHRHPQYENSPVTAEPDPLMGQILEVRIWERARTRDQIQTYKYGINPATPAEELLFHWITDDLPDPTPDNEADYLSALELSLFNPPSATLPAKIPLTALAEVRKRSERYRLSLDKLGALWSDMNHSGKADNRTLFDTIYNPLNLPTQDRWTYYPTATPVWDVANSDAPHQQIRTRLMSTLRVSHSQLNQMVAEISGADTTSVLLSSQYLSRLYRLKLLSKMLKLKIGQLRRLMAILRQEGYPLNDLAGFTLSDVMLLEERANWMNDSGINISEYDFLVYDVQDGRVAAPFDAPAVVELAGALKDQAADFLAGPLSLVSDEITEAASEKIFRQLSAAGMITPQGAVSDDFRKFSDLSLIAEELNWYQRQATDSDAEIKQTSFRGLYISEAALLQAGIIDDSGMVSAQDPQAYSIAELEKLVTGNDPRPDRVKVALVHDLITRRSAAQQVIPTEVTGRLRDMRTALESLILTSLTGLLAADNSRLQLVYRHTDAKMSAAAFLGEMAKISAAGNTAAGPDVENLLYKLSKVLFLLGRFELSDAEIEILLSRPETFGITPAGLVKPSYHDLNNLYRFRKLKQVLRDSGNGLLGVLQAEKDNEAALQAFTGWKPFEIRRVAELMGIGKQYNTIASIWQMAPAFDLAGVLGAEMEYLVDLSDTGRLDFAFFQRHAGALFDILRANYEEDIWASVYKPLHDMLAVRKRDSLTTVAMENLAAHLPGRKSPDLLYEYLLIDVQMGSETDTARIVQGIAALQLYVTRCLMNLEKEVAPEQIPLDEWQWMKNYRVWEANRKVFLYPENYIEPELRDTKTPLFQKLEEELLQGEINKDTAQVAFTRYLDKLAEVTDLDIVGAYYHTEKTDVQRTHALKFCNEEIVGYVNLGTGHRVLGSVAELAHRIPRTFSVEMWVKHDHADDGGRSPGGGILGAYNLTPGIAQGWRITVTNGKIQFWISTSDRFINVDPNRDGKITLVETPGSYPANRWLHLAITYDGNTAVIYVNGNIAVASSARSGNIYYPAPHIPLVLGALIDDDTTPADFPFRGEIREVYIWNSARSREAIRNNMNKRVAGRPPAFLFRSGYLNVSSVADLENRLPNAFSAEFWIKHSHRIGTGVILSASSWMPDHQKGWLIEVNRGKIALRFSTDDPLKDRVEGIDGHFTFLQTAESYPADTWLHVAVTYDDPVARIFVNGIQAAETRERTGNIYYPDIPTPFLLGAYQNKDLAYIGTPLQAEIRELRLWKRARSQSEIFTTMHNGVVPDDQGAMPASLVNYWKMDDGPGESGNNVAISDYALAATPNPLDITDVRLIEWIQAENTAISEMSESEVASTLYLVGKKKANQEFYFRELVNGVRWLAWKKIDLGISADYVSPVFAFGRLYLFWAEIQQGIVSQPRRHTLTIDRHQVDQIGEKIDPTLGETVDKYQRVHENHGTISTIMQVPVTDHRPVIKYSFYNFSKAWTQPQNFLDANRQELRTLTESESLMPKWRRVYVQRSMEFVPETETAQQPPPERIPNVTVLSLGARSYLEKTLPRFIMDELTLSFIAKAKKLRNPGAAYYATVEKPAADSVTLLTYGEDRLFVTLTSRLAPIAGKIEAFFVVDKGFEAVAKSHEALRSIQAYRKDQNQDLVPAGELHAASTMATASANAAAGHHKTLGTRAAGNADNAVSALNATPATIPADPPASATVRSNAGATLAEKLADTAESADAAAAGAALISIDAQTDAASAKQRAVNTRAAAIAARASANLAKAAENQNPPDKKAADTHAGDAETKLVEALTESLAALVKAESALSSARVYEAGISKWESGQMTLDLRIGAEQLVLDTFSYDSWRHITVTLERSGAAYQVQAYAEGIALGSRHSVNVPELPAGRLLRIGATSNRETVIETLMSEFRLWNYARPAADIRADNRVRKTGREIGLLHLPLDGLDASATTTLVTSDLDLIRILPPFNPLVQRERIIMIYGDNIRSLRSNLEDQGLILQLETREANIPAYGISLSPSSAGTFLRIDQAGGINVDHYAPLGRHPLDRYAPNEKNKLLIPPPSLPDKYFHRQYNQELSAVVQGQTRSNIYPPLLKDLENNESYILDIHNHPAWYIFDAGDEQFLVKINIDGQRIRTAEERLRFRYNTQTASLEAQPVSLYFERDFLLEVHPLRQQTQTFEFERLNTFAIQTLSDRLFSGGIDALLNLKSQQTNEPDFGRMKYSDRVVAPKNNDPAQDIDNRIDFKGAYGLYYREVFFHIPFLIANHLNANQQFAEAQKWYHYIFNPTAQEPDFNPDGTVADPKDRYWRYREFRGLTQATLTEMLSDAAALAEYRRDPFDPHAIAGLRINAYQKAIVMKYIDNLLDWGDNLFRQDTRESINEAIPLYVLAFNLLGPRPTVKKVKRFEQIGDYQSVKSSNPGDIPDFLAQASNGAPAKPPQIKIPFNPNSSIETRFCVIENEQFMSYWDRVEDRLYKIRHSLNIDGVFRSLALFQPPIDPAALVAAAAAGGAGGIAGAIAGLGAPVPHYRFSFMLEKAKELTETAISLGGALLDALEKKDGEALTVLQHGNETRILEDMTAIKTLQIREAEKSKAALEVSKKMAQLRQTHFERLLGNQSVDDSNISSEAYASERGQIDRLIAAIVFKDIGIVVHTVANVLQFVPDTKVGASGFGGSPVAAVHMKWARGIEAVAGLFDIIADSLTMGAEIVGLEAGFARREEEWKLEKQVAEKEKEMIDRQIEGAQFQIEMAKKELKLHQKTIGFQKEVGDFYKQKFTNQDLYNWMKNKISDLYFRAYQMAFDTSKLAEKAFQFEFGTSEIHITFGHWDNRRQGLLAGESLLLDIQRLEKSALAQDSRYLEIEKTISLAELDPLAFLQLRDTGSCQFSLTELLFDRDYPGHYFRIIKSVSISIPAEPGLFQPGRVNLTTSGKQTALAPGAYQAVKATLTQTGHKTLLAPDINGVQYLMGESSDMPGTIRADWRANQQIAISTGVLDSGLFELNFNDDRYLPFEGTGAVSNWHLEIPKATNPIDFNTLTDVIIQLRYMCKIDGGKFKQDILKLETFRAYRGVRLFSLVHEFSAQWKNFRKSNSRELKLALPGNTFPPNVDVDFDGVFVKTIFSIGADSALTVVGDQFDILLPEATDSPQNLTLTAQKAFQKNASQNLLVLLGYEGQLMGV